MAEFVKHVPCSDCGSSDARAVYSDGSDYCWNCHKFKASGTKKKQEGKSKRMKKEEVEEKVDKQKGKMITPDELDEIKEETTVGLGLGYRGINDDTLKKFGVRHTYYLDDKDKHQINERYYPVTRNGVISGFKIRETPKKFRSVGGTGADCELFMQSNFKMGGKYVIITEGEEDALAAYQMLRDYQERRNTDYDTPVVSPTTGAMAVKQIQANYKWFDTFEQIIISYDNDEAGQTAIEKIIKVLPKGKVKIMKMRHKDANEYLKEQDQKNFVQDFYNAEPYRPVGILGSGQLYDKVLEQSELKKIPLPPFVPKLKEMLGDITLGHIYNIIAGTSVGKTTVVNEFVYSITQESPYPVGVITMELDAGQYGEVMLSRHLGTKLAKMGYQEKQDFLMREDIQKKGHDFFFREDGTDRFFVLDDRDGSVEDIKEALEELIVGCGCKLIILDPLQDIMDGLTIDEQAVLMKFFKGMVRSHGVSFILINHVRKMETGKETAYGESDTHGSSTIIKSASANILIYRDKLAENVFDRNTTRIVVSKNRILGETGDAGNMYYDSDTHTIYDKDYYFNEVRPDLQHLAYPDEFE